MKKLKKKFNTNTIIKFNHVCTACLKAVDDYLLSDVRW